MFKPQKLKPTIEKAINAYGNDEKAEVLSFFGEFRDIWNSKGYRTYTRNFGKVTGILISKGYVSAQFFQIIGWVFRGWYGFIYSIS